MATVQKKEKGLNKHSFKGLTPDQINELTQEQVVELFRARQRRRFSRSISCPIQKSNIDTLDSMLSAKRARRTPNLDKNPLPLRLTSEMLSFFQKWSAIMWLYTTERPSTMSKSSLIWSEDILESSHCLTNLVDMVKLVWEPPRGQHIVLLNDLLDYLVIKLAN